MERKKKIFGIEQLSTEVGRQEVRRFFEEHKFCVIELDEATRKNQVLENMANKAGFLNGYKKIAVIAKGEGTISFKGIYHRSISNVDNRMLPHKQFSEVFTHAVCTLLQDLNTNVGEIHIRGMRQARVRVISH
ncbi:MAG: hypothetical protein WCL18_00770 [bacterium]